ncbi:MAG: DUF3089 domain-containing protein [Bacteroidia bacterium]
MIRSRSLPLVLGLLMVVTGCGDRRPPRKPFAAYDVPPAPEYRREEMWSALPGRSDEADQTPPGVSSQAQEAAAVDVFFIHPTSFAGGVAWNAHPRDAELNARTDHWSVRHQASVFNAACRVYAPRYRQMCLGGFYGEDTASRRQALDLAYSDIVAAFDHYLRHYNDGRPFILAGHSQGSLHGIRLLREQIDGRPLQARLVAAYLPGWPLRAGTLQQIPLCDSADQTGCVATWYTWKKGYEPPGFGTFYRDALVVNPVNWRADTSYAPADLHRGYLGRDFGSLHRQRIDAQVHGPILWVSSPFAAAPVRNFHVGDYNLFWLDIRENVARRVGAYLAARGDQRR